MQEFQPKNFILKATTIFVVLVSSISFNSLSQIPETTVEIINSNDLNREIQFLKKVTFNNGDSLFVVTDISKWQETRRKSNVPAVFISTSKDKSTSDTYLYNYYALTDKRGLIPKEKEVADLNKLHSNIFCNIKFTNSQYKDIQYNSFKNKISISSKSSIQPSDFSPNRFELFYSKNSFSVWSLNQTDKYSEFANSFSLQCGKNKISVSQSSDVKSSALPILTIETWKSKFSRKKLWSYKEVMPNTSRYYDSLLFQKLISTEFMNQPINDYIFRSVILFEEDGSINQDTRLYSYNDKVKKRIDQLLINQISKFKYAPIYKDRYLKTEKSFAVYLDIKKDKDNASLSLFDTDRNKFNSLYTFTGKRSSLQKQIKRAQHFNFKYVYYEYNINASVNNFEIENEVVSVPKRVKSTGYINSLLSILPGAGVASITRKSQYRSHYPKYKTTFLISAGVLLTSAVVSNNIKSRNYALYKEATSINKSNELYKKANLANKVLLTSIGTYALLSLIDFTFTFKIATKNKTAQRRINKAIRKKTYSIDTDLSSNKISYNSKKTLSDKQKTRTYEPQVSITNTDNKPLYFTDSRDGKKYKTVVIGKQTWMAENLAYKPKYGNYWAYDNNSSNIAKYGYLYDFNTACQVCPKGWHLPSYEEWMELSNYLGASNIAGNKMKSTSGWKDDGNGTNVSGFSGLPGGSRLSYGPFDAIGKFGSWWSSTEYSADFAWARGLDYYDGTVLRDFYVKRKGLSVRCLRD